MERPPVSASLHFLHLREFIRVFCGPAASVLYGAGLRCGQVPVYDARRVLAGTAIVEILASSIKVAPARQSICWINLQAKVPWDARVCLTPSCSVAPPLSSGTVL